ncbi:hypothetical protein RB653_008186 [Dictyostelium firmibasis]|uniref:Uncharacterized protein n=1 Tax=Dictyostelium firmibasis TaxID=79012 RepID=A0AAN7TS68_9MYCE
MMTEFGSAMTLVTGLVAYGAYVKSKRQSNHFLIKATNDLDEEKEHFKNNINNDNTNDKKINSTSIFESNNQIKRRLFD